MRHLCIQYVYGCISCAIVLHIADVCLPYDQLHLAIVRLMMVKKTLIDWGVKVFVSIAGNLRHQAELSTVWRKDFN